MRIKEIIQENKSLEFNDGTNTWNLTPLGSVDGYGNGGRPGSTIEFYAAVIANKPPKGAKLLMKGHSGNIRGITGKPNLMTDPDNVADKVYKKYQEIRTHYENQHRNNLKELSFHGRACTKDCSGHKAGWDWERKHQTNQPTNSQPSFDDGVDIAISQRKAGKHPIGTNIRGDKGRFQKFQPQMEDVEVDEIIGMKKYHDMDIETAVHAVAKAMGTKWLGGGYFANAIASKNPKIVYKVFGKDDAYLKFANYAMQHPHPSFPKIYKIKDMTAFVKRYEVESDRFYVAAMERLIPLNDDEKTYYLPYIKNTNPDARCPSLPDGTRNTRHLSFSEILDQFPNVKSAWEAKQIIAKDVKTTPNIRWDLHGGNVMKRVDGSIVITDPITSDEGFAYQREIEKAQLNKDPMVKGPRYAMKKANQVNTIDGIKRRVAELEKAQQNGDVLDDEDNMVLSIFKRALKKQPKNDQPKNDQPKTPANDDDGMRKLVRDAKKKVAELKLKINQGEKLSPTDQNLLDVLQQVIAREEPKIGRVTSF